MVNPQLTVIKGIVIKVLCIKSRKAYINLAMRFCFCEITITLA